MKCILVVPGNTCGTGSRAGRCLPLFPLIDRPFLQHVVEHLAERGVTDVQFVLDRHADAVERFQGDGVRWGGTYTYHLTRDPDRPGRMLRGLAAAAAGEHVLIGRADQLPQLPPALPADGMNVLFDRDGEWTGWAVVAAVDLIALPTTTAWPDLERTLAKCGAGRTEVPATLRLRSLEDVSAAQRMLLDKEFAGVLCSARELRPGVWVSRNVSLSPSTEIIPPVFLGENTAITARALVGPYTVVGADCLLDDGCEVAGVTVLPSSYVGPGVGLDGVIVEGRQLIDPRRRTAVNVDPHLLDSLAPPSALAGVARVCGRAAAGAAFVACLPVLAGVAGWLAMTRPGRVFWPRRYVRLTEPGGHQKPIRQYGVAYTFTPPRPEEAEIGWVVPPTVRGIVLELLPALAAVAGGQLRLVGLPPRNASQLKQLPVDQYPILTAAPVGLVTEAALSGRALPTAEDVLLADVYQAHTSSPKADLVRLGRFAFRALTPSRRANESFAPAEQPVAPQSTIDTAEMTALPPAPSESNPGLSPVSA